MRKSHVCRCCLTKGCSKNLDDELENYGEMLTKTFNLTLDISEKFICDDCIVRLHDAAMFKQQILDVDTTFNKLSTDGISMKLEPILPKTEDITYGSDIENKVEDILDVNKNNTEKIPCKKTEKLKYSNKQIKKKSTTEIEDHKIQIKNSIKLITNSNICLFKSLRTRFACYVCNEKYFEMNELRIHSKIHSIDDVSRRIKRLRGKSYENADISNLSCNICKENCTNLDILIKHLNKDHNIIISDANLLIPYKLEEGMKCQICKESFNTFTRLSIHMNSHATSNVCETCGMAFFNRISLRNHIRATHKEKKCSQCTLIFQTSTKLVRHKRIVHNAASAKHHCQKCNMTFRYHYLLKNHMIDKHGGKVVSIECSTCRKVFRDQNSLKSHFRNVHLNERNYTCSICELSFFTRTGKIRHEKIHIRGSLFTCNVCDTKFKSKDSVRRHMRRQHIGGK